MVLKAARRGAIPPFIVMEMLAAANRRAAERGDVLHLELGEPSTPAPAPVIAEAKRILDAGTIGYTESTGLPALRVRLARYYRERDGLDVDPDRIVITTGSSAGFILAFLAAFEPGDRVALAAPGYPAYRNILQALDVVPVIVECGPESNFQPTPEILEKAGGRLDGLIVASPSNPTGTILDRSEMRALADYCESRGIRFVSDEIYHGITFDKPGVSALSVCDDSIVINSFSKYFSMMGWRLGWMIVPPDLVQSVERLCQNLFISAPTLSQRAALAVFDCGAELDANVARYRRNRDHLMAHLPRAGFDRLTPAQGAFYLYADVRHMTNDSQEFCRRMLEETGVATTPGIDFDPARGHQYLRLSFAGATADIEDATRRLAAWRR